VSEPKYLPWTEYEWKVLDLVSRALANRGAPDKRSETAELVHQLVQLMPYGISNSDLFTALTRPPYVCAECGATGRWYGDHATCVECRQKAEKAELRRTIEAEVRAELQAEGAS
jgi:hypothetical protein